MREMETRLLANEEMQGREIEVTSSSLSGQAHNRAKTVILLNNGKKPKKLPTQHMGQCVRCGYLSSQEICKACTLLEGLNKNKPKMEVRVGGEEDDQSPRLNRRMGTLTLGPG